MCVSFIEIQKNAHQWRGFSFLRAEEAADMFECANCHVMKIRDFQNMGSEYKPKIGWCFRVLV